jgi:uncharacterized protein YndB with AHSA1/START domain
MENLVHHLGAVIRSVKTVDRDGRPATAVIAMRSYDTDIDDLWNALTSADRIPRWFMPIEGDLRLGGRYQLKGNAGGIVTGCEPPRQLAVTWEYAGDTSWVQVTLEAETSMRTRLMLEHTAHVPKEFWDQYGPGAVGVGWDLGLLGLALHIDTGASNPPEESAAWMASDDGKTYVRGSSDDWREAVIANGADPRWAAEAAERTRKFYTGEA